MRGGHVRIGGGGIAPFLDGLELSRIVAALVQRIRDTTRLLARMADEFERSVGAIVGSVALAGLLSSLLGIGLLSGAGMVLRRLTAGVVSLVGLALPGLALLRGVVASFVATLQRSVVVGPQVLTWKSVRHSVVGLRAPPSFA